MSFTDEEIFEFVKRTCDEQGIEMQINMKQNIDKIILMLTSEDSD